MDGQVGSGSGRVLIRTGADKREGEDRVIRMGYITCVQEQTSSKMSLVHLKNIFFRWILLDYPFYFPSSHSYLSSLQNSSLSITAFPALKSEIFSPKDIGVLISDDK